MGNSLEESEAIAIKSQMFGLSFREYLELSLRTSLPVYSLEEILASHERIASQIIDICEGCGHKILLLFQAYLKCGYYPYFFEMPNEELYLLTLEQNLHATIESDLVAIYPHLTGVSLHKIKQLLIFIAKAVPFMPNWTKIKDTLDIGDIRTVKTYFQYLEEAFLVRTVSKATTKLSHLHGSEKVYLDNPNQMQALSLGEHQIGTQREVFFLNMLSLKHAVHLPPHGDFLIDSRYFFEVGGRHKSFECVIHRHHFNFCANFV